MILAGGIDLGGTKVEAQKFDADWNVAEKKRVQTPSDYKDLVQTVAMLVDWLGVGQKGLPIGIAAAGLNNDVTGNWIAANLPADGKPFIGDVATVSGTDAIWLNDCRAFTLAEATFGNDAGRGTIVGLVLGTGVAGGVAIDGHLINSGSGQSGEFGHFPIAAATLDAHNLPVIRCGCGRMGCYETYGSGPGMERLAAHLVGQSMTTREIVDRRDETDGKHVWDVWCEINAQMIFTIMSVVDPNAIVLGGGLSKIQGISEALAKSLAHFAWSAFPLPQIRICTRGETAAALGAAFAAWEARRDA